MWKTCGLLRLIYDLETGRLLKKDIEALLLLLLQVKVRDSIQSIFALCAVHAVRAGERGVMNSDDKKCSVQSKNMLKRMNSLSTPAT